MSGMIPEKRKEETVERESPFHAEEEEEQVLSRLLGRYTSIC